MIDREKGKGALDAAAGTAGVCLPAVARLNQANAPASHGETNQWQQRQAGQGGIGQWDARCGGGVGPLAVE